MSRTGSLQQIAGRTWCLYTPMAVLPFYHLSEDEVVLMDSGAQRDSTVADCFAQRGLRVAAVLYTHGHFDHVGGDRALRERFGCVRYLPEADVGCTVPMPPRGLCGQLPEEVSHFIRDSCFVPDIPIPAGCRRLVIRGAVFSVLPCPGHTQGHVAYTTPDQVCYLGDLLACSSFLSAAKLLYAADHTLDRHSKEHFLTKRFTYCVAAHRGVFPGQQLPELLGRNLARIAAAKREIAALVDRTLDEDELLERASAALRLSPGSAVDAYINQCSIRSYLEDLVRSGTLTVQGPPGSVQYSKA